MPRSNNFMYGRFLVGHTPTYAPRVEGPIETNLSGDDLRARFDRRTARRARRASDRTLTLQSSTAAALLLLLVVFRLPMTPSSDFEPVVAEQEVVAMQEIVQTRQQTAPPPPPAPPIPVEVANDVIIDDEEVDFDASLDLTETLAVAGPPAPEADGEAEAEEEMDIFVAVEQMPEMIGGTAKLMSDLTYPSLAVKAGLEGTVIVQVVVGEDGVPRQPMVVRSGGQLLDEAAVAAVMKQRFHPGKQRNEAVPVRMAIPVRFALT